MKINQLIIAIGITSVIALQTTTPLQAATKNVGDSNFGAKLTGSFDHSSTANSYQAHLAGRMDGIILGASVNNIGSGESYFRVDGKTSQARAWGNIKFAGSTLVDWDKTHTTSADFSTWPYYLALPAAEAWFWAGPIPLRVKAGAVVVLRGVGNVTYGTSNGRPSIKAKVGPSVEAVAYASAASDVIVAAIGVRGSLTLGSCGTFGSLEYVKYDAYTSRVNCAATFETRGTGGSLSAFARVGYGWLSYEYTKNICSYPVGSPQVSNLITPASFWVY